MPAENTVEIRLGSMSANRTGRVTVPRPSSGASSDALLPMGMPDRATVETSKAAVGYEYCNKLFAQERICKKNNPMPKGRREYCQNVILPILEEYFCWLETVHPEKGSKLYDAVTYARNQKDAPMAFVDYGDVPISNNLAKNAIRPFTVGRKNWLFCDSVKTLRPTQWFTPWSKRPRPTGLIPMNICIWFSPCFCIWEKALPMKHWKN